MVMSTPVRIGRVSSREAARPTLVSVSTKGSRPIANASLVSNVEVCGKSLADQALRANSARPILTGVLMTILGDTLKMVATDSYRLAVKETKLEKALETEVQAIVPVRALGEVARLA